MQKKVNIFFYTLRTFNRPVPYPMHKKKFTKNLLNYYLLKVKKFYGDSVKNESARAKKTRACLGLKSKLLEKDISFLRTIIAKIIIFIIFKCNSFVTNLAF